MYVSHGDHAHGGGSEHEHGHGHSPYLEHHFETLGQQFESDKLGMWLFLATEILLFGGLFCAYSVYRGNHPEIFVYAHQYLNKMWGGINTVVLLFSSFTMAWAVRATQLNQRGIQIATLILTILCAFGFMGIKYVEYSEKWKHGLLPGAHYHPHVEGHGEEGSAEAGHGAEVAPGVLAAAAPAEAAAAVATPAAGLDPDQVLDASKIPPAAAPPAGLAREAKVAPGAHGVPKEEPKNVQTFFAIYFVMTGLHGVHVLAGIIAIFIVLLYAIKGIYKPEWYAPVDMVALYWHIVDLVWIFLFPLLYLIH